MDYFDRLGALLEDGWKWEDRDEERFPEVAHAALEKLPPGAHLDLEAFADEVLDPHRALGRQLAPLGAFGQPGVTAFYGRGFVIDVYFWTDAISAIHNHPFCGVFTLLRGSSVHARYRWQEREALGPRARLGELSLAALELVEPGHVERFSLAAHPLVHALVHVAVPSVSMVVRTIRTLGYLRYFPPSLAIAMDEPDEPIARQLAMLDMLRVSRDPQSSLRRDRFLRAADFETSFRALSRAFPSAGPEERAQLIELVRERHGDRALAIEPALRHAARVQEGDAIRARLRDDDDRLVATALMLGDGRPAILDLVARRHADPVQRLHRFVDEAGLFEPDEEASTILAHGLVDGDALPALERRLVDRYGAEAVAEQEKPVRAFVQGSVFSALAR